uniref:ATP-binding cassette domain-containing protein n=1 Tax=Achromobacter insuavis TaxID=1287735 RepID=UPI0035A11714
MTDLSSLPELASLPQPLIRLDAVSKSFATRAGRFDAVRDVSLSMRAGDTFGIIGKSGAGKSTLLRLINLLERPDAGTVRVGGTELTALGKGECISIPIDVSTVEGCKALANEIVKREDGKLDILVNNAGV